MGSLQSNAEVQPLSRRGSLSAEAAEISEWARKRISERRPVGFEVETPKGSWDGWGWRTRFESNLSPLLPTRAKNCTLNATTWHEQGADFISVDLWVVVKVLTEQGLENR